MSDVQLRVNLFYVVLIVLSYFFSMYLVLSLKQFLRKLSLKTSASSFMTKNHQKSQFFNKNFDRMVSIQGVKKIFSK